MLTKGYEMKNDQHSTWLYAARNISVVNIKLLEKRGAK